MTLGNWRDLSLILLAFEAIVIGLVYGLIFYYLWKGFRIATTWLRGRGLPESRRYSRMIKQITQQTSEKIVQPFITLEATWRQAAQTIDSIAHVPKQRNRR